MSEKELYTRAYLAALTGLISASSFGAGALSSSSRPIAENIRYCSLLADEHAEEFLRRLRARDMAAQESAPVSPQELAEGAAAELGRPDLAPGLSKWAEAQQGAARRRFEEGGRP